MKLIAVYGSLRSGEYNNGRYGLDKYDVLGTELVSGYDLFDTQNGYPYIILGSGTVVFETYLVDDDVAGRIEQMERGAGYGVATIDTEHGQADIFLMPDEVHKRYIDPNNQWRKPIKVGEGDWSAYLASKELERV